MHIAFGQNDYSRRHPCFKVENVKALNELQLRIWKHFEVGGEGKPAEADKPGDVNSGQYSDRSQASGMIRRVTGLWIV